MRAFLPLSWVWLFVASGCAPTPAPGPIAGAELAARLEAGSPPLVLDVRTPSEYSAGHVPGAINIPHTELENRLDEIGQRRDIEIVVYCRTGRRAAMAEALLLEADFSRVRDLKGHMKQWQADGHPVQP